MRSCQAMAGSTLRVMKKARLKSFSKTENMKMENGTNAVVSLVKTANVQKSVVRTKRLLMRKRNPKKIQAQAHKSAIGCFKETRMPALVRVKKRMRILYKFN